MEDKWKARGSTRYKPDKMQINSTECLYMWSLEDAETSQQKLQSKLAAENLACKKLEKHKKIPNKVNIQVQLSA